MSWGWTRTSWYRRPPSLFALTLSPHPALQERVYQKPVVLADREMVESQADAMLAEARAVDVAFLVVGDPFG